MTSLLVILQHADTAFPSGGFAFSNGLEALAAEGMVASAAQFEAVMRVVLRHRWATADRVALVGAHRAYEDHARLAAIDAGVEAATLAERLRAGSRRNGAALLTAHDRLGTPGAAALKRAVGGGAMLGHLPVLQGALWRALHIDEAAASLISGYTTAAGLCAAAVRLGCVGALEAQRLLAACLPQIAELAAAPVAPDAVPRSFTPWIDAAAARHARGDLLLFAS